MKNACWLLAAICKNKTSEVSKTFSYFFMFFLTFFLTLKLNFLLYFWVSWDRDNSIDFKKLRNNDFFLNFADSAFCKLAAKLYLQVFQATPNTHCSNCILFPFFKEISNRKLILCNDMFQLLF